MGSGNDTYLAFADTTRAWFAHVPKKVGHDVLVDIFVLRLQVRLVIMVWVYTHVTDLIHVDVEQDVESVSGVLDEKKGLDYKGPQHSRGRIRGG